MIREAIAKTVRFNDLSEEEAAEVMAEIMTGKATPSQVGSFMTAMSMKGEKVHEIAAFAKVLRESAAMISPRLDGTLVDTCGTGGDGSGTFNISTAAALVAAGAGVPVVKHGNRSVSSACGSADVLEELGVNITLSPLEAQRVIEETGIGFLYAPGHHPAMRYASGSRNEIGIKSFFNILGPLANPAGADAQLLGVYDPSLTSKIARVLEILGTKKALVVHGSGIDEITTTGETIVSELSLGKVDTFMIDCTAFGVSRASPDDLKGGDARENAGIITAILTGADGPRRDVVVVNAAAAIYAGGLASSIQGGMSAAERSIDSGKALDKLNALIEATGGAA